MMEFLSKLNGRDILYSALFLILGFIVGVIFFKNYVLLAYPKILEETNPGANIINFDLITPNEIMGTIDSKLATRIFLQDEVIFPEADGTFYWERDGKSKTAVFSEDLIGSNCLFVASSNGKNYYPSDHWRAKTLSPDTLLCFPREAEAINLGLEKGK